MPRGSANPSPTPHSKSECASPCPTSVRERLPTTPPRTTREGGVTLWAQRLASFPARGGSCPNASLHPVLACYPAAHLACAGPRAGQHLPGHESPADLGPGLKGARFDRDPARDHSSCFLGVAGELRVGRGD